MLVALSADKIVKMLYEILVGNMTWFMFMHDNR